MQQNLFSAKYVVDIGTPKVAFGIHVERITNGAKT